MCLCLHVDSDGLSPEPVSSLDFDAGNEYVDMVPDLDFHVDSVSFGSSLKFEDDSSGFSVNSGLGFSKELSGDNLPLDFEVESEFFHSQIKVVVMILNKD